MAAAFRQPLAPRPHTHIASTANPQLPSKSQPPVFLKRPRSPEPIGPTATYESAAVKRHRTQSANAKENVDKQLRKADREARENEFRLKYTKAFPSWTFYFDTTDAERNALLPRVAQLGGRNAKFFSNEVTHFITNRAIPPDEPESNKENTSKSGSNASLRSPIKLKGLPVDVASGYENLVRKAKHFGMKIWDTNKLDSVLKRCYIPSYSAGPSAIHPQSLTSLLESEKRMGASTECDPAQKRHDFHYFSKGSYFVLVEDMRMEYATIAAHEYAVTRTADGEEKVSWPVPYCHPLSRGPFIEYSIKEERRREKMEKAEKDRERERAMAVRKLKLQQMHQRKENDLRRSVSLSNLHRNFNGEAFDLEDDLRAGDYTASGLESNGYIAASGNSVSIASTAFGTTSTMGVDSSTMSGRGLGSRALLRNGNFTAEFMTSKRVAEIDQSRSTSFGKASASSAMMPPPEVPNQRSTLLRKCKSTNTLRMPKRDEKLKPGYCESCRQKYEDFRLHVRGRRHQKFANTEANFIQLDFALNRLRRKTKAEVAEMERKFDETRALRREYLLNGHSDNDEDQSMPDEYDEEAEEVDENGAKFVYLDDE